MTLLATLGYAVQGGVRTELWPFFRLVDSLGPVGSGLPPLDDGREPDRCRGGDPRPVLGAWRRSIALLLCLAGAASASLSLNLFAVGQMFAGPRAAGTWMGFQNAIGNLSGIFGPILTGFIVQHAGYDSAFVLTAAIAAIGALWWALAVPRIAPIDLVDC